MNKKNIAAALAAVQMLGGSCVKAQDNDYLKLFEELKTQTLPKIQSLLKECEDRKIFVDYENASCRVIEKYIDIGINDALPVHKMAPERGVILSKYVGYGNQDVNADRSAMVEYIYNSVKELSGKLQQRLAGYLDGSVTPVGGVDKYVTSKATIDGQSFIAEDENGERKPTFFTGYGHFGEAMTDIPIFSDMGVNVIEIELGPAKVMKYENGNFVFDESGEYFQKLMEVFDSAAKNNVGINLLLSPHYMSGFMNENFPDETATGYFNASDKMREYLECYISGVMERVKDKPALNSICLTNEPAYKASETKYLLPKYQKYLSELYENDISGLNACYNTEYSGFDKIEYPNTDPAYTPEENPEKLPQLWDYIMFNDAYYAEVHEFMFNIVNKYAPELGVGAKVMQDYDCDERSWRRNFIFYGSDVENLGKFLTINGNDANNYYDPQDYQWDILNKMSYYDLQTSIRNAPVFDFEDHVIRDRNALYGSEIMPKHLDADMWQGALHGRGGTTIWVWERTYDDSHDFSGSILNRPIETDAESKAMLDIHRLSDELTKLQNAERNIGILQSRTARLYSLYNSNALTKTYEGVSYLGERVEFVTERQAAGGKLDNTDIDILIVPLEKNVLSGTAEAVKKYIENGGKVILIGDECFQKDQYNNDIDESVRKYIFENSTLLNVKKSGSDQIAEPASRQIFDAAKKLLDKNSGVKLIDKETGEPVYEISYTWVKDNGTVLVNLCNYSYEESKKVSVYYNGQPVNDGVELRSMENISCTDITAEPIKPILIRFADGLYADSDKHWASGDIKALWSKGILASAQKLNPEENITVGEFAGYLSGCFDIDKKDIAKAGENEILTREKMAEIILKVCEMRKLEIKSEDISEFTDSSEAENREVMEKAVGMKLISGTDDKKLLPRNNAKRAEAISVVRRLADMK